MAEFQIYPVVLVPGTVAISPVPGVIGDFGTDLKTITDWSPSLVISVTTDAEMRRFHAADLPERLSGVGIKWRHFPVKDFGEPESVTAEFWPGIAKLAHEILDDNGKVLIHCRGGQGRSGMVALRLMIETGIPPAQALARLRAIRPGAVETDAQLYWANSANVRQC